MKQIYNEGRVVGLSSYELYVRQFLSTNPEGTPLSEREWLAATIATNKSMILRIPGGTTVGTHDYELPLTSSLRACTVIYGSMFEGSVELSEDGYWATSVTDYNQLINNTASLHPFTPGTPESVPAHEVLWPLSDMIKLRATNYMRIREAAVIQPGRWVEAPPGSELGAILQPDLNRPGFVRVFVTEELTSDVYIHLFGFVNSEIYKGQETVLVTGETARPQDGDFLGPEVYPWACPVTLLITNAIQKTFKQEIIDTISVPYIAKWMDDHGNYILTEEGQNIDAERFAPISQMWEETQDADEED